MSGTTSNEEQNLIGRLIDLSSLKPGTELEIKIKTAPDYPREYFQQPQPQIVYVPQPTFPQITAAPSQGTLPEAIDSKPVKSKNVSISIPQIPNPLDLFNRMPVIEITDKQAKKAKDALFLVSCCAAFFCVAVPFLKSAQQSSQTNGNEVNPTVVKPGGKAFKSPKSPKVTANVSSGKELTLKEIEKLIAKRNFLRKGDCAVKNKNGSCDYLVTSDFYHQRDYGNHAAIDLGKYGIVGTKLLAHSSGNIVPVNNDRCGFGLWLYTHGGKVATLLCHLKYPVKARNVAAGEKIGVVGETGNINGAHIHAQFIRDGVAFNPPAELVSRLVVKK